MNASTSASRYSGLRIGLHWAIALLIAAAYALIELREIYPKGSDPRELMKTLHFMLGLSVLFLAVLRVAAALGSPKPAIVPAPPAWQHALAGATHGLLYLLMLGLRRMPAHQVAQMQLGHFIVGQIERRQSMGFQHGDKTFRFAGVMDRDPHINMRFPGVRIPVIEFRDVAVTQQPAELLE